MTSCSCLKASLRVTLKLFLAAVYIASFGVYIKGSQILGSKTAQKCATQLDVVLVLDGSTSITKKIWNSSVVPFAHKLVRSLNLSKEGTRLGIIEFSDNAIVFLDLNGGLVSHDGYIYSRGTLDTRYDTLQDSVLTNFNLPLPMGGNISAKAQKFINRQIDRQMPPKFYLNVTPEDVIKYEQNTQYVNSLMNTIPYLSGNTATDRAIAAAKVMLTASKRRYVPKLLILVTDGSPTSTSSGDKVARMISEMKELWSGKNGKPSFDFNMIMAGSNPSLSDPVKNFLHKVLKCEEKKQTLRNCDDLFHADVAHLSRILPQLQNKMCEAIPEVPKSPVPGDAKAGEVTTNTEDTAGSNLVWIAAVGTIGLLVLVASGIATVIASRSQGKRLATAPTRIHMGYGEENTPVTAEEEAIMAEEEDFL